MRLKTFYLSCAICFKCVYNLYGDLFSRQESSLFLLLLLLYPYSDLFFSAHDKRWGRLLVNFLTKLIYLLTTYLFTKVFCL
jgi:hypothetical protein